MKGTFRQIACLLLSPAHSQRLHLSLTSPVSCDVRLILPSFAERGKGKGSSLTVDFRAEVLQGSPGFSAIWSEERRAGGAG